MGAGASACMHPCMQQYAHVAALSRYVAEGHAVPALGYACIWQAGAKQPTDIPLSTAQANSLLLACSAAHLLLKQRQLEYVEVLHQPGGQVYSRSAHSMQCPLGQTAKACALPSRAGGHCSITHGRQLLLCPAVLEGSVHALGAAGRPSQPMLNANRFDPCFAERPITILLTAHVALSSPKPATSHLIQIVELVQVFLLHAHAGSQQP